MSSTTSSRWFNCLFCRSIDVTILTDSPAATAAPQSASARLAKVDRLKTNSRKVEDSEVLPPLPGHLVAIRSLRSENSIEQSHFEVIAPSSSRAVNEDERPCGKSPPPTALSSLESWNRKRVASSSPPPVIKATKELSCATSVAFCPDDDCPCAAEE